MMGRGVQALFHPRAQFFFFDDEDTTQYRTDSEPTALARTPGIIILILILIIRMIIWRRSGLRTHPVNLKLRAVPRVHDDTRTRIDKENE